MDFFKEFFEALGNDLNKIFGETITLGDNPITTLNIIVWSLYIGFIIGIGITVYNRCVLGTLIRKLIERQAFSDGGAVTVAELGCGNPFIKFALREKGTLRRIVYMVGDTPETRKRESFDTAKFYLPEQNIHRAEVVYGSSGMNIVSVLLSVLAFLVVVMVAFFVIPNLIQMLTNFIAGVTPNSNIL
ncbi:MAG: hypothetical protein HFE63_05375 [Clostridiales bacterium]|nr:hypothetical protein [Clostridiales bacterium]